MGKTLFILILEGTISQAIFQKIVSTCHLGFVSRGASIEKEKEGKEHMKLFG
jgi:hypothetical protein